MGEWASAPIIKARPQSAGMITRPKPPLLSVIVVSYQTRELVLSALRSLFAETARDDFEVLVVDNASTDGSADAVEAAFPEVILIRSDKNVGFAAANNIAAKRAAGRFLLLLNPDTLVHSGAVDRLLSAALEDESPQIWGGRTFFGDGTLNASSCWARPTPWSALMGALGLAARATRSDLLNPEGMGSWDRSSSRVVDIVSGCFLLIRADLWRSLSGFDSRFFMYGEDADLCLRAHLHGARPTIIPDACITHYGGRSERTRSGKMIKLFTAKAQLFALYQRPLSGRFCLATLSLWAVVRLAVSTLLSPFGQKRREDVGEWWTVLRHRREWVSAFRRARATTEPVESVS